MSLRKTASATLLMALLGYCGGASARYIEADPIGLKGGINPYVYASANPITHFDPSGLDCTSAGGRTLCNYPGGPAFNIPTPDGFPAYLGPSNFLYHSYEVAVSTSCDPASAMQGLINDPAPGSAISPATFGGTPNVAQAGINNPIISYLTNDLVTGDPMVVNITSGSNGFSPGYVARTVSGGSVHNYGEGLSSLQSPMAGLIFSPALLAQYLANQYVWRTQTHQAIKKCGCGN